MKIIGINIGANNQSPMGRGNFNSKDKTFCYIPLEETDKQIRKFTYRGLGMDCIPEGLLDMPCHYDPEFKTNTYGHKLRCDDKNILLDKSLLNERFYILFYATLNIDNDLDKWDVFAVGYFEVEKIVDIRNLTRKEIFALKEFQNNAHLNRQTPKDPKKGLSLLIKGNKNSRLFRQAIPFSDFQKLITTSSGKKIEKKAHGTDGFIIQKMKSY